MQQIPLPKQLKIAFLARAGCTQRQIVYRTETSLGTVNKYVKMINQEEDDTKIDCKKQIKFHSILFKTLQNPFLTNLQISKFSKEFEFSMSESTVQRIVVDLKIRNTYQKPKEKLSVEQKLNRVKFARNILKSELILFPWVFSDESMIILDETGKKN